MEDRIVIFKDSYSIDYCRTNATPNEIEESIEYKNDVRMNEETPKSDFELIQEYLKQKNKYIEFVNTPEEYWW